MYAFRRGFWLLSAIVCTGLIGGCPPVPSAPIDEKAGLYKFSSGDELLGYFKAQARARHSWNFRFLNGLPMLAGAPSDDGGGAAEADAGSGSDFTGTNLQEAGVDESDLVKTDGAYLYVAQGRTLHIVRAVPHTDLEEVASVDFDGWIDSIYLHGGHVIVLGRGTSSMAYMAAEMLMWPPYYVRASTVVASVDVSDPAQPSILAEKEFDGGLASSRLIGDRLVLILSISPELPANPTPIAINAMTLDDVLPKMRTAGGNDETVMVGPTAWYRPMSPDGYFATAIVTIDAGDIDTIIGQVAVMANAGTIYATTESLYVTDSDYDENEFYREATIIHKFAFDASGVAQYVGSGKVPGRLLNQWSLGEHEGYLRAATHVTNFNFRFGWEGGVAVAMPASGGGMGMGMGWGSDVAVGSDAPTAQDIEPDQTTEDAALPDGPYNSVYVLSEDGDKLVVVGRVEGIAPNEDLYAARFLGTRGFLVTFEVVDPLFTLDLSDPANPVVLGELIVPGYSDYLHPVGENRLIGVGRSVVTSQWGGVLRKGVQLSLFDVSDFENPALLQQVELGGYGSYSDVNYNPKAFAFLAERGLLALPVSLWEGSDWYTQFTFDGVVCYTFDADEGFDELGRLAAVPATWYGCNWRRGVIIGDALYAVSDTGVRAAALSDLGSSQIVEFPQEDIEDWVYDEGSTEPAGGGEGDAEDGSE